MKISKRVINIFLGGLLIVIGIISAIQLYFLPKTILWKLGIPGNIPLTQAYTASIPLYISLGFFALIAFLLIYLMNERLNSQDKAEVIYVERRVVSTNQQQQNQEEEKSVHARIQRLKTVRLYAAGSETVLAQMLSQICKELEIGVGILYKTVHENGIRYLEFLSGFAYEKPDSKSFRIEFGEGLTGQVAKSAKPIVINDVPAGYIEIYSGLGKATAKSMAIYPILNHSQATVIGVLEVASFLTLTEADAEYLKQASELLAIEMLS
ncbi:MAG: GAF domain-containing protein [Cytophagales bacterium]|nr:GAF domain-containing protein [Cytophagales bacterium]MDW8383262.1 GAF domain-containing protein [Flammeovirgaceae bacterium]